MARLLVADDNGIPYVEITEDDDGYHGTCPACRLRLYHHRLPDLIENARIHVDRNH